MTGKLRNREAEAMLLDIRVGRHAARQDVNQARGAFLVFPTSVVIPGAEGGELVYPLRSATEPGTLVTGAGAAQVTGQVAGVAVRGEFHWSLGEDEAPAATYRFTRRGREVVAPSWAPQLPSSQDLLPSETAGLARQQLRLRRRGREAEHRLLTLSEQVLRGVCQGPLHRAIRYRPLLDDDDVMQRGLQAAGRLLPVYTSPARPPCSWLAMLRLDGRRDMHREVARLDGYPSDAAAALSLAGASGVARHADPSTTWAQLAAAAQRLGRTMPRIGSAGVDAALRAPVLLAQGLDASSTAPGPEATTLERVHHSHGRQVVASVARLMTDDDELVALAVAGDPQALRRVGDRVVHQLGGSRGGRRQARRRCWEEFESTGELFSSAAGLQRFSPGADAASLAAIDDRLRRAAGLHHLAPNP